MTENLPTRHRLWILTLVTYSPNYIVFTGMAYLTGEWRSLSRLAAGVTIIPLILLMLVFRNVAPHFFAKFREVLSTLKVLIVSSNLEKLRNLLEATTNTTAHASSTRIIHSTYFK